MTDEHESQGTEEVAIDTAYVGRSCDIAYKKAVVQLRSKDMNSPWEPGAFGGNITLMKKSVILAGYRKMSLIGRFLSPGLLGALLIKPFFMSGRKETIDLAHIEKITSSQNVYHLFQVRHDGITEVHTFLHNDITSNQVPGDLGTMIAEIRKAIRKSPLNDTNNEESMDNEEVNFDFLDGFEG